ncbi:MAG: sulfotransferase [Candidatus Dormibacterales bacterium]
MTAPQKRNPAPDAPLTVVYITGPGRTGSTLLGNALNEVPGFFHAGELLALWQMLATSSPTRCGCGKEIPGCPVWSRVLATPVPGEAGSTIGDQAARAYAWVRSIPFQTLMGRLLAGKRLPPGEETEAQLRLIGTAYRALREVTGARIIIDSSKAPLTAAAVTMLDGVRPFFVHLVRDPRAVTYSWLNPKGHLTRQPARFSARYWRQANLASQAIAAHLSAGSSLTVRYEDFVEAPGRVLASILEALGEDPRDLPLAPSGELLLTGNHTVIGNPGRDLVGQVRVSSDRRWEKGLSTWDSAVVAVSTYPMMRSYGYRWFAARRGGRVLKGPGAAALRRRRRRVTALAVTPALLVTLVFGGWWLLAASTAAPVRGLLSVRPLAEVASHVAALPLPASVPRSASARKGLILNHPWPLDHARVGKGEAEHIAKASVPGRPRVAGAVLASTETEGPSDVDCLCWVIFIRRGGSPGSVYAILVDAQAGRRVSGLWVGPEAVRAA